MGKVLIEATLSNHRDENWAEGGYIPQEQVREMKLEAIVDTGAVAVGLPVSIIQKLGLPEDRKVTVTLSNGQKEERMMYKDLAVQLFNRKGNFGCIGKPDSAPCLIGQIVLETMDLVVDGKNQRLIPNPEAPEGMMLYDDF